MRTHRVAFVMPLLLLMSVLVMPNYTIPVNAASTSSASPAATPLFSDDFEAATLGSNWTTSVTNNGVAELSTNYHYSGSKSVFLGQKVAGGASASLVLALDLSGQTDVFLDFWTRRTGAGAYRTVSISDNAGASWKQIVDLSGASQTFSHHMLDLASVATTNGLTLNSQFRIGFYFGNYDSRAGDGFVIDDVRLTQRAQELATFPLAQDSFETNSFKQGFYPQSYNEGVAELNTNYPHSGSKSVFLGQKVAGGASASLVLALDLSGQTDVFLDFWARRTGTGAYRIVSISDNAGASWKQIVDLNGASQTFSHHMLDLANVATTNGLTLNSQFYIRFYFGNYDSRAGDGFVIDDVRLTHRDQVVTSFPFGPESFESGDVQQGLYLHSYNEGVTEINTNYPHSGTKSLFLGQKVDGGAISALVIAPNISGRADVLLDFWTRTTGNNAYRSVSISDDGGTNWKQILDLNTGSQTFNHYVLDIASAAKSKGLTLNNEFRILFYYGNYTSRAGDGLVIDDLKLVRTSISGKVYNTEAKVGNEVGGALVEACSANNVCQTIATNADGSYGFGDIAGGTYTLRALPPAGNNRQIGKLGPITLVANTPLANQDIVLPEATGTPPGTTITPRVGVIDGVPSIFWRTPVTLTQKGCSGGTATYQVTADGVVVRTGNLVEAPAGTYTAQLAPFFPLHGTIQTTVNVQCPNGPQPPIVFNVWIDPSGLVVNTRGEPVPDATVSLYRSDVAVGPFSLVPSGSSIMSPANRVNPMKSDSTGVFGWDVIAGFYRVRAERAGCTAPNSSQTYNETAVLTIPPPVTDLRIVLYCGEKPQATTLKVFVPLSRR